MMGVYLLVAAPAYGLLADWRGALALTLAGLATIVGFRGLEAVVGRLGPQHAEGVGCGTGLAMVSRLMLLGAALVAILHFGSDQLLAVVLGVSALPAALMAESARALVLTLRSNGQDG